MDRIKEIIEKLQATSSRLEKIAILEANKDNQMWKSVLKFLFDPMVVTGISAAKLNKKVESLDLSPVDLGIWLGYFAKYNTGRDFDIGVAHGFMNANPKHAEWLGQLVTKSLKLGIDTTTINKVYGKDFIKVFAVMLAESFADNPNYLDGKKFIVTKKLDGLRCVAFVFENGEVQLFTRNGKEYGSVPDVEADLLKLKMRGVAYDGELIAASKSGDTNEVFRETSSVARTDGVKVNLVYHIFDCLPIEDFFAGYSRVECGKRKKLLRDSINSTPDLFWIEDVKILYEGSDQKKIAEWGDYATSQGWEGVMLNVENAPYQAKRVCDLLKVKKFKTVDVRVTGVYEGENSFVGTLGGINCEFDIDGVTHKSNCGSGFTKEQREKYWSNPSQLIGKIVELKCFEVSKNKDGSRSLRFPIWLDIIRFDKDTTSVV